MNEIFETSFDTFAYWYLDREMREKGRQPVPLAPNERRSLMETAHGGKTRDWFVDRAQWLICELTSLDELEQLMILQCDWTQYEGFPRFLGPAARRARQSLYFTEADHRRERHQAYYRRFIRREIALRGSDRVALCTLNASERSQAQEQGASRCRFYLHDGLGRLLPYLALVQDRVLGFTPVEAFVAFERKTKATMKVGVDRP